MASEANFEDRDWTVAPGAMLDDWREDQDLTREQAAQRCGFTAQEWDDLVAGRTEIDAALAERLAMATGTSENMWINLERTFREDVAQGRSSEQPWIEHWCQGGPADGHRIKSLIPLPDEILLFKDPFRDGWLRVVGPWPGAITYVRQPGVEQFEHERIYYPVQVTNA